MSSLARGIIIILIIMVLNISSSEFIRENPYTFPPADGNPAGYVKLVLDLDPPTKKTPGRPPSKADARTGAGYYFLEGSRVFPDSGSLSPCAFLVEEAAGSDRPPTDWKTSELATACPRVARFLPLWGTRRRRLSRSHSISCLTRSTFSQKAEQAFHRRLDVRVEATTPGRSLIFFRYPHLNNYLLNSGERFLATIFESPSTCAYKNHLHKCTFTFTCWLVGGTSHAGCGDEYDWLFTCCVPSSVPIAAGAKSPSTKQAHNRTPIKRHDYQPPNVSSCGIPAIQLQKRIIGGNEAYFGEFPWQAHIRIAGYQCGGVLVSPWFVVTAAHCIHRARLRDIKVFLGEYDTQNTGNYIEPLPEEIHKVSKKILHPYFQFKITQPDRFDIALLKLSRKVQYRENILPICLPGQSDSFEGYIGVVAGWGKTDTTYGKTGTNVLQKAGVPILSDEECLQWHQHKNIHVELHREMFCAGHSDGRMDACLGDSGGPLIVLHRGKWTLAGITSAGFGCAVDHQPGIYHKVALTSKWIATIINKM